MTQIPARGLKPEWLHEVNPELLVVNKPPGLAVLRDRSGALDLWQRLTAEYGKLYLVHRIDKATSGLLLVARTQPLQSRLTRAFQEHAVRKLYLATVAGNPSLSGTGTINLPLRKGRKSRFRIAAPRESIQRDRDHWYTKAADLQGLASLTRMRCVRGERAQATLALAPLTGRTHQLRVHLAWIGHPILGDRLYGRPEDASQHASRLLLHAARLRIPDIGSWNVPALA